MLYILFGPVLALLIIYLFILIDVYILFIPFKKSLNKKWKLKIIKRNSGAVFISGNDELYIYNHLLKLITNNKKYYMPICWGTQLLLFDSFRKIRKRFNIEHQVPDVPTYYKTMLNPLFYPVWKFAHWCINQHREEIDGKNLNQSLMVVCKYFDIDYEQLKKESEEIYNYYQQFERVEF